MSFQDFLAKIASATNTEFNDLAVNLSKKRDKLDTYQLKQILERLGPATEIPDKAAAFKNQLHSIILRRLVERCKYLKVDYLNLDINSLDQLGPAILEMKDSQLWRVELAFIDRNLFSAMRKQYNQQAEFHYHINAASIKDFGKEVSDIKENLGDDSEFEFKIAAMEHFYREFRSRMACALSSFLVKKQYIMEEELW